MAAAEACDEACLVVMVPQGECRQLQSGDPPFHTCMQERILLSRQGEAPISAD